MKILVNMAEQLLRWYGTVAVSAVVFKWRYDLDWSIAILMALVVMAAIGPAVLAAFDGIYAWIMGDDK